VHRAIKAWSRRSASRRATWKRSACTAPRPSGAPTTRRRDVEAWLKSFYMQDHVGDEFDGTISGVTSFGLFITLDELYVDGLVHVSDLGQDYYKFDPQATR
jgi:ribonuclease R